MGRLTFCAGALCLSLAAGGACAAIYDEAIDGDLSNEFSNRTALGPLSLGSNLVTASLAGRAGAQDDLDQFTFIISAGTQLSQIIWTYDLGAFDGSGNLALIAGETSDVLQGFNSRGYTSGSNVLPDLLGAGTYTFDIRAHDDIFGMESYSLDLRVAAVPLPAAGWLVLGGLAALGLTGRRRKRAE